jgi:xylan 1,4-beta-xylosidase
LPALSPGARAAAVAIPLALSACSSKPSHHPSSSPPADASSDATVDAAGDVTANEAGDAPSDQGMEAAVDAGLICSDPAAWTPDAEPETTPPACAGSAPWADGGVPASDGGTSNPDGGEAGAPVSLTVDASALGAAWNRFYERVVASDHANTVLCTSWGRNIQNAMRKAHDEAGFQYVRFHGILDDDVGLYSEDASGAPVYAWARFDAIYDAITGAGMRPIVEISFMPKALASDPTQILTILNYNQHSPNDSPPKDWTKWQNLMAAIVTHLEGRYGADEVRQWYFEIWNEPSAMYSGGDGDYPFLYRETVTGLLQADPQVRVGGPAGSSGESPSLIASLIQSASFYKSKLDFVTYHRYSDDQSVVADPATMLGFHQQMAALVASNGFTGELLNDEFGASWKPDVSRDTEVSASFIAKTIHLIGTDTVAAPPTGYGYWAISDLYEEVYHGTGLVFNEGNFGLLIKGDPAIPDSFDIAKPSFNAFRLLHMMGDQRLAVSGGTTGDGVNAAATMSADGSALQILVYNHVAGGQADPTQSTPVTLTVDNVPFATAPVRIRQYVVDHTHANAYTAWVAMGKPAKPTQAQWSTLRSAADLCYYETTATLTGGAWTAQFPQNVYGVSLIEIARQ